METTFEEANSKIEKYLSKICVSKNANARNVLSTKLAQIVEILTKHSSYNGFDSRLAKQILSGILDLIQKHAVKYTRSNNKRFAEFAIELSSSVFFYIFDIFQCDPTKNVSCEERSHVSAMLLYAFQICVHFHCILMKMYVDNEESSNKKESLCIDSSLKIVKHLIAFYFSNGLNQKFKNSMNLIMDEIQFKCCVTKENPILALVQHLAPSECARKLLSDNVRYEMWPFHQNYVNKSPEFRSNVEAILPEMKIHDTNIIALIEGAVEASESPSRPTFTPDVYDKFRLMYGQHVRTGVAVYNQLPEKLIQDWDNMANDEYLYDLLENEDFL